MSKKDFTIVNPSNDKVDVDIKEQQSFSKADVDVMKKLKVKTAKNVSAKKRKKSVRAKYVAQPFDSNVGEWFALDNAASIYPATVNRDWMFVYRISAVMKKTVDAEKLQQAVNDILPRFPTFNVSIKRGLFWYFFEKRENIIAVEKEHTFPCQPFEFGSGKQLIRFLYFGNRISFECFHALADGRGSMLLFNTLLYRYLQLCGVKCTNIQGCLNYMDFPLEEEVVDSFFEFRNEGAKNKIKEKKAFKITGTNEEVGVVNVTNAIMSVENIKSIAKQNGCSIYVFLCACLAYSVFKRNRLSKKPVKVSCPIDLRSFFPSSSLRNFSSYINVEVPVKDCDWELADIIEIFKNDFKKINKDYLLGNINANTAIQKNFFIKILPLVVKDAVMKICFKYLGENYQTLAFSNLGVVETPPEFLDYVDRYEVNLGRNKYNNKSVGVVSFGDKMTLTISSKIKENVFERDFIRLLAKLGVKMTVESNRRDMYAR